MRHLWKWQFAGARVLALSLITFTSAQDDAAQASGYTVTDLGTLGGEASKAYGLDDCGRVVGEAQAAAGDTAPFRSFQWKDGVMTDLQTLGGQSGTGYAISQSHAIVGASLTSKGSLHAYVRETPGSRLRDIGTLGGLSAEAQDINASGQVVGHSEDAALLDRAFLWSPDTGMKALSVSWGSPIRAFGINDAGQIVGSASHATAGTHAFVTIGGTGIDLGTLGGAVSIATEVNGSGEVSGYSSTFSPTARQNLHAFRWKDLNGNQASDPGEMLDLGLLETSHGNSYAYDINDAEQIVGASEGGTPDNNFSRAFLWQDTNGNHASDPGEMQALGVLVPGSKWTFQEARAINNHGQIAGTGLNPDGKVHAFLLTPLPTPAQRDTEPHTQDTGPRSNSSRSITRRCN